MIIKKIAKKYDTICNDTNSFKYDKRKRQNKSLESDIEYNKNKKEWFTAKMELIKQSTFMNRFETLIKGKEYNIKLLLWISSIMSTFGIMVRNKWIVNESKKGLHINFNLFSSTTLLCIVVSFTFYIIMSKAYKHFNNIPQLLSHFDKTSDRLTQKIINLVSIGIVFTIFIMSMTTNVIAFHTFGCDYVTSVFIGVGIDLTCIYCTWYHNKFTSLDGYQTNNTINSMNNLNNVNSYNGNVIEYNMLPDKLNINTNNDNDKKARTSINILVHNTPNGKQIKYNKNEMNYSSSYFYKILNDHKLVEKRGNKYYKIKKVV